MGTLGQQGNPFAPEPGKAPGHLAGRDEERRQLDLVMARIARPRPKGGEFLDLPPCPPVKIIGAPGTGKTALLHEARRLAAEHGVHAVFIGRLDDLTPGGQFYADLLAGLEKGLQKDIKRLLLRVNSLAKKRAAEALGARTQMRLLTQVLRTCLAKQPLALLVDEAAERDPDALGNLLLMCKEMMSCKYPLALLLAGPPGLERTLVQARTGFMDLAWRIDIGLLTPPATAEALRGPFEDKDVKVKDAALERMADMAGGCPLCTQMVGSEVWNAMAAAAREEVDKETVKQAEAKIQNKRNEFYRIIYGKMRTANLVGHARHAMEVLRHNGGRAAGDTIIESLVNEMSWSANAPGEAVDVFNSWSTSASFGRRMARWSRAFLHFSVSAKPRRRRRGVKGNGLKIRTRPSDRLFSSRQRGCVMPYTTSSIRS